MNIMKQDRRYDQKKVGGEWAPLPDARFLAFPFRRFTIHFYYEFGICVELFYEVSEFWDNSHSFQSRVESFVRDFVKCFFPIDEYQVDFCSRSDAYVDNFSDDVYCFTCAFIFSEAVLSFL